MKAIISIANVAARSGKTTIAVNLAAEIASRGLRTLLIDADPQARATRFFMKDTEVVRTLTDILLPESQRITGHATSVWDVFSPSGFPYMGVVASDIGLAAFDGMETSRAADLGARLGAISDFHDVAIFDTPSSLALIARACLCASTHVIVPVSPGTPGEEGLRLIAEFFGNMPCGSHSPDLRVVCNQFDCHERSSGLLDERLRNEWGGKVFETIIHRDSIIEVCADRLQPARSLAPMSAASALYARLADEVLAELNIAPAREIPTSEWME